LEATVAAQPLYSLEYDLGLIDKQVRMLRALVDVSPVVHHASAENDRNRNLWQVPDNH
jgi:hypothetical protein